MRLSKQQIAVLERLAEPTIWFRFRPDGRAERVDGPEDFVPVLELRHIFIPRAWVFGYPDPSFTPGGNEALFGEKSCRRALRRMRAAGLLEIWEAPVEPYVRFTTCTRVDGTREEEIRLAWRAVADRTPGVTEQRLVVRLLPAGRERLAQHARAPRRGRAKPPPSRPPS